MLSDYLAHDAMGLAELVRTRAASARELLDIAIARAEAANPAINAIVRSPDIAGKLASLGAIPRPLGPKEFGEFLIKEDARWSDIVKKSGVTVE